MASFDYVTSVNSTVDASSYTFSGVSLGAADPDRLILVHAGARASSARTITGLTVAGIAATELRDSSADQTNGSWYIVAVPTGTTGDIVATYSGTMVRCNVAVFRLVGIDPTPVDVDSHGIAGSSSAARTVTMDSVAGGYAAGAVVGSGASVTFTWSGVTEDYDFSYETSGNRASGGHGTTAGSSVTVTATPSGSILDGILVAITFQPSATPINVPVDPATLTLTGEDPPFTGTSLAIAADTASLALEVVDSALMGAGSAPATVDPADLLLTGVTPATDATIVVTVDTATLQLGGQTPALTGSGPASVAADVATLTIAPAEQLLTGAGATSTGVDPAALALTGQTPALAGSGPAPTPVDTANLTLTGVTPQIAGGPVAVTVDPAALTLTAITPTLAATTVSIAVDAALLILSGVTSTLTAGDPPTGDLQPLVASRTRTGPAIATTRTPDATVTVRTGAPTIRMRTPQPLE